MEVNSPFNSCIVSLFFFICTVTGVNIRTIHIHIPVALWKQDGEPGFSRGNFRCIIFWMTWTDTSWIDWKIKSAFIKVNDYIRVIFCQNQNSTGTIRRELKKMHLGISKSTEKLLVSSQKYGITGVICSRTPRLDIGKVE